MLYKYLVYNTPINSLNLSMYSKPTGLIDEGYRDVNNRSDDKGKSETSEKTSGFRSA